MEKYPISSYNKYICLKADGLMLAITLYLLKPYILALASIAYRKDKNAIINIFYPHKSIISYEAAAAIPILFLLFSWTRRSPEASQTVRNIWKNGKTIILITSFLQLCITSSPLWITMDEVMSPASWIQSFIYLSIIIVTPLSRYMKDCFADFPEQDNSNT